MLSSLSSLSRGWKSFGPEYILKAISWRLPRRVFHYSHSFLVRSERFVPHANPPEGYQFRLAISDDSESFANLGVESATVLNRLSRGDQCGIAVSADGSIVSMVWAATGDLYLQESGVKLAVDSASIYRYNAFTHANNRQKGLYAGCCAALDDYFVRQGRTHVFGAISRFNLISQSASGSVGTQIVGEVVLLTIFGLSVCRVKSWPHAAPKLRIFFRAPAAARVI